MSATVKDNVAVSEAQRAVQHGVVRAVGVIGAATLASRVLGFVRDMVMARAFGAGSLTDAFFVAFRIPNLLRRLLAEGALSTAIIPVFTEYPHGSSGHGRRHGGAVSRLRPGRAVGTLDRAGDGAGLGR
jgi:peptidoglycan biosynthesis protein MviN/MurJ (putative lipid II flippase)